MPDRPRKDSRNAPDGPSEEALADGLHNERLNFAKSQSNAKLCIAASAPSDKAFAKLLRKVSEAAKCLGNRHAKIEEADVRAASSEQSQFAATEANASTTTPAHSPSDANMSDDESADSGSTTSDTPAPDDSAASHAGTILASIALAPGGPQ